MLRRVARTLARVRGGGRAFYCERHTFAVIFPHTSAHAAVRYLDLVRQKIELTTMDLAVPVKRRPDPRSPITIVERTVAVTISVGVAASNQHGADPREIMRAAHEALERAKHDGMDRVAM
jgi:diguanylate cyclase (GGDEF)-like protein